MKQQLRELRNKILRKRLKNHDLKLRFDTPTANLYIPFPDYIFFLKNLKQLVYAEFTEIPHKACPAGLLGG